MVAHQQADLVTHNIAVRVIGRGEGDRFKLHSTRLVTFGPGSAGISRTTDPKGLPPKGEGRGRAYGPSPLIYAAEIAFEKW